MQILSNGERMLAICQDYTVEWYIGSHTANVTNGRGDIDCFTFAWEKNRTQMLDFTTSLLRYLED